MISMCLQKLMNIHHCIFKVLGKKTKCHGRTHGRTDGWTDGQQENSIPHHKQSKKISKVCGGYNYKIQALCLVLILHENGYFFRAGPVIAYGKKMHIYRRRIGLSS